MSTNSDHLRVTAKRWRGGWELHIAGRGVTQTRTLDKAERQVWDYMETLTGERCEFPVDLRVDLDGFEDEVRGVCGVDRGGWCGAAGSG